MLLLLLLKSNEKNDVDWLMCGVCGRGQDLFVMVAFILHLGNVTFDDDDDEGFAVVSSVETLNVIDSVRT